MSFNIFDEINKFRKPIVEMEGKVHQGNVESSLPPRTPPGLDKLLPMPSPADINMQEAGFSSFLKELLRMGKEEKFWDVIKDRFNHHRYHLDRIPRKGYKGSDYVWKNEYNEAGKPVTRIYKDAHMISESPGHTKNISPYEGHAMYDDNLKGATFEIKKNGKKLYEGHWDEKSHSIDKGPTIESGPPITLPDKSAPLPKKNGPPLPMDARTPYESVLDNVKTDIANAMGNKESLAKLFNVVESKLGIGAGVASAEYKHQTRNTPIDNLSAPQVLSNIVSGLFALPSEDTRGLTLNAMPLPLFSMSPSTPFYQPKGLPNRNDPAQVMSNARGSAMIGPFLPSQEEDPLTNILRGLLGIKPSPYIDNATMPVPNSTVFNNMYKSILNPMTDYFRNNYNWIEPHNEFSSIERYTHDGLVSGLSQKYGSLPWEGMQPNEALQNVIQGLFGVQSVPEGMSIATMPAPSPIDPIRHANLSRFLQNEARSYGGVPSELQRLTGYTPQSIKHLSPREIDQIEEMIRDGTYRMY